jgi:hypothetical protein
VPSPAFRTRLLSSFVPASKTPILAVLLSIFYCVDSSGGDRAALLPAELKGWVWSFAFAPDGKTLAVTDGDKQ